MFPQMNDKFDRFIAPARVNTDTWLFLASIAVLLLLYSYGTFLGMAAFVFVDAKRQGIDMGDAWLDLSARLFEPTEPMSMIILLVTFVAMFLAPWIVVKLFRDQPLDE